MASGSKRTAGDISGFRCGLQAGGKASRTVFVLSEPPNEPPGSAEPPSRGISDAPQDGPREVTMCLHADIKPAKTT